MLLSDIAMYRLYSQRLARSEFTRPEEVVAWMGAVQGQEFGPTKWSLGMRAPGTSESDFDAAFVEGRILRTHLMRPTWHLVAPADIRWLLALTAPHVNQFNAYMYRQHDLDATVFARCHHLLAKALEGGKQLTRPELMAELARDGLVRNGVGSGLIMMEAELAGLICSGARRGKQFTYALLEERVLPARALDRDEALAELTRRYFLSHGPATAHDFSWWSGLPVTQARRGSEMVKAELSQATVEGQVYWMPPELPDVANSLTAFVVPIYDEYLIAFKDRSASVGPEAGRQWGPVSTTLTSSIVIDGRVVGVWRRMLEKGRVLFEIKLFRALNTAEEAAVFAELEKYGRYYGLLAAWEIAKA